MEANGGRSGWRGALRAKCPESLGGGAAEGWGTGRGTGREGAKCPESLGGGALVPLARQIGAYDI